MIEKDGEATINQMRTGDGLGPIVVPTDSPLYHWFNVWKYGEKYDSTKSSART